MSRTATSWFHFLPAIFLLFSWPGAAQAQSEAQVETYRYFSKSFQDYREIRIFLPHEYHQRPDENFPVIYLFDGQSEELFRLCYATLDLMFAHQQMPPAILIGVVSQNRQFEFSPTLSAEELSAGDYPQGGADYLRASLEKEIFRYLQKKYRVNDERTAIGHSFGASFLYETVLAAPEMFDRYVLISPNLIFDNFRYLQQSEAFIRNIAGHSLTVYATCGTDGGMERSFLHGVQALDTVCRKGGLSRDQWLFEAASGYNHSTILLEGIQKGLLHIQRLFHPPLINEAAYAALSKGDPGEAVRILTRGVTLFPSEHNLFDSLGEACEAAGDQKAAASAYRKAIAVLELEREKWSAAAFDARMAIYRANLQRVE